MVRTLLRLTTMFSCIATLWSACSSADEEETPVATEPTQMRVGAIISREYAAELGYEERPAFTFWDASTFLAENGGTPKFYFFVEAPKSAITYSPKDSNSDATDETTWYDTGHTYLPNDQTVLASGYMPADMGSSSDDYQKLKVPSSLLATEDVWIADKSLLGSTYNPFDRAMSFVHATTRITFKAMLAQGMQSEIRNVVISIPESEVLYNMTWQYYTNGERLEDCRYWPDIYNREEDYLKLSDDEQKALTRRLTNDPDNTKVGYAALLPTYSMVKILGFEKADLGTYYLRPEQSQVLINVHAIMYTTVDGDETAPAVSSSYDVIKMPISFGVDEKGLPVVLHAGDQYEITLLFNNVEIELSGRKLEFKDGGNVYIPIQPFLPDY